MAGISTSNVHEEQIPVTKTCSSSVYGISNRYYAIFFCLSRFWI